jgi:hypothetical protein
MQRVSATKLATWRAAGVEGLQLGAPENLPAGQAMVIRSASVSRITDQAKATWSRRAPTRPSSRRSATGLFSFWKRGGGGAGGGEEEV